jgi:site-specific recombinase XerD
MKFFDYRPAKLCTGSRWYVYFYYRVPAELREKYNGKKWRRFKVNQEVNRWKDHEYANALIEAVNLALKEGLNPFEDEKMELLMDDGPKVELSIKEAVEMYLTEVANRGLSKKTVDRYTNVCELLHQFFVQRGIHKQPVSKVKKSHIKSFLVANKQEKQWSNRQYNNVRDYIFTMFEYLRKEEVIDRNPVELVDSLSVQTKKHKYYDKILFPKVTRLMSEKQPYLWQMAQFVYYGAVRSSNELRHLKVGDIMEGGDLLLFRAEVSKSNRDDIVPVDPNLKKVFEQMGLLSQDADPDKYIFSIHLQPGERPVSDDFIAKRFRKIRSELNLSQDYTLYGFKHSRCVHLLKDGVKLSDISKLFRHTDIATTAKYARDLGVDFDASDMMNRSRKI